MHALIQETMIKQTEPMETDIEIVKKDENQVSEKNDAEQSENKLESRSEDGGQSIRVRTNRFKFYKLD